MLLLRIKLATQVVLMVKNLPVDTRDTGDTGWIPGSGRSSGGGKVIPSSIPAWRPYGQRSLAGYSSMGLKEPDMTEPLNIGNILRI